ncbi:MAG TPA: hypothetical protein VLG49_00200 [Rhabdochlamydiaceae bacterium]|nr:hypothetical protein [Rhabdochlamydiaceae bacterium]
MRKWLLGIATVLSCSVIHANFPEKVEILSSKVILQNTNGYFVLSDGSCWKTIAFSKRWRSIKEWWRKVQLVPKNYECVPNDWYLGTNIEVYSKYENLEVDEANASNQDDLKQCTHLLVNTRTGQVLFAIALHPADCIVQLHNDSYGDGYSDGFSEGRMESHKNATDIYNSGYADGQKAGYAEGYQAAFKEEQPEG